ncbi:MAG: ECF transporter S component [Candidatus Helarchaeota archaeon]
MRKSNLIFICLVIYGMFIFLVPLILPGTIIDPNVSSEGIIINIIIFVVLFIISLYFKVEELDISTKEISLIIIYSTFTAVSRIPFVAIPSVQPCSYLIFCAGFVFGPLIGFIIGSNTALISNLFLGQGPWTIYQMVAWGLIGITGGLLNLKKIKVPNKYINSIIGFGWGFLFGWIMNVWFWAMFMRPLNFQSFILASINSFYFDLAHAISNFIFLYYFGNKTINILYRYRQRFNILIVEFHEKRNSFFLNSKNFLTGNANG